MATFTTQTKSADSFSTQTKSTDAFSFQAKAVSTPNFLQTEGSFYLLLETGDKIILEQSVVGYTNQNRS